MGKVRKPKIRLSYINALCASGIYGEETGILTLPPDQRNGHQHGFRISGGAPHAGIALNLSPGSSRPPHPVTRVAVHASSRLPGSRVTRPAVEIRLGAGADGRAAEGRRIRPDRGNRTGPQAARPCGGQSHPDRRPLDHAACRNADHRRVRPKRYWAFAAISGWITGRWR